MAVYSDIFELEKGSYFDASRWGSLFDVSLYINTVLGGRIKAERFGGAPGVGGVVEVGVA